MADKSILAKDTEVTAGASKKYCWYVIYVFGNSVKSTVVESTNNTISIQQIHSVIAKRYDASDRKRVVVVNWKPITSEDSDEWSKYIDTLNKSN